MEEHEKSNAENLPTRPVARKSGSRGRISRRLVITSTAAIVAVYAVGFVRTQAAADRVSAAERHVQAAPSDAVSAPAPPASVAPTEVASHTTGFSSRSSQADNGQANANSASATQPAPQPTATATPAATRYRDGTYDATGTSRHGDIAAQVTVKGGKIVSTEITGCYTRYPCSRISDLTGAVVSQQSTNVDLVTGATDSSEAFLQAVDQALRKALG